MVQWTWCHCWVPLQGANCSVLWLSGRGAIAGCHCRVPLLGATLQGAVDVVPLLGAFVGCHCSVPWLGGG